VYGGTGGAVMRVPLTGGCPAILASVADPLGIALDSTSVYWWSPLTKYTPKWMPIVENGVSCGTDAVCYNGGCNSCTAGESCGPVSVCQLGAISCSTGNPVCAAVAAVADGTNCGSYGYVCIDGGCAACAADAGWAGCYCQPDTVTCYAGGQDDAGFEVATFPNSTCCGGLCTMDWWYRMGGPTYECSSKQAPDCIRYHGSCSRTSGPPCCITLSCNDLDGCI
jgi:hypothetical protein